MNRSMGQQSGTWRSAHGDMSDEEWELIADLVQPYSGGGRMGRPIKVGRRQIVDAIFFVAATGCQWRALPDKYGSWTTVHHYHVEWSRNGTWEKIAARLAQQVRVLEGHKPEASAGIIDARSVRGAATVTSSIRGYDAGKKISGRKTFGLVDTLGMLIAVAVVAASTTDNDGGILVVDRALKRTARLGMIWCDSGFKRVFARHCHAQHVKVEVVKKIHPHQFEVLPQRWIVERTWSWIMNNRRLQIDYERFPEIAEGFVWAAHSRLLLRRLTHQDT